jgi:hypothetical protein
MLEEKAPPPENWDEHLKSLSDRDLADFAKDYRWLDVEADTKRTGPEFHRRREAIIAELERRGMHSVAQSCRRSAA